MTKWHIFGEILLFICVSLRKGVPIFETLFFIPTFAPLFGGEPPQAIALRCVSARPKPRKACIWQDLIYLLTPTPEPVTRSSTKTYTSVMSLHIAPTTSLSIVTSPLPKVSPSIHPATPLLFPPLDARPLLRAHVRFPCLTHPISTRQTHKGGSATHAGDTITPT